MNRILLILLLVANTCTAQMNDSWVDTLCVEVYDRIKTFEPGWRNHIKGIKPPMVAVKSKFDTSMYVNFSVGDGRAQLLDNEFHIIEDGYVDFTDTHVGRYGIWYGYYASGKPKWEGRYEWSKTAPSCKIGEWKEYYENGQLKRSCNYQHVGEEVFETDLYGSYKECYVDGTVAIEGAYGYSNANDTVKLIDPSTGIEKAIPKRKYTTTKSGIWRYYNKDGTLKYKEDYP